MSNATQDELEQIVQQLDAGVFAAPVPEFIDPEDILSKEDKENVQQNVALLLDHEAFKHLTAWIKGGRARYWTRVAEGMANNDKPVDQREIDYKRGFWAGATWFSAVAPKQAASAFLRRLAEDEAREELTD